MITTIKSARLIVLAGLAAATLATASTSAQAGPGRHRHGYHHHHWGHGWGYGWGHPVSYHPAYGYPFCFFKHQKVLGPYGWTWAKVKICR